MSDGTHCAMPNLGHSCPRHQPAITPESKAALTLAPRCSDHMGSIQGAPGCTPRDGGSWVPAKPQYHTQVRPALLWTGNFGKRYKTPHSMKNADPHSTIWSNKTPLCAAQPTVSNANTGYNTPGASPHCCHGETILVALPATPTGLLTCVGKIEGHADWGVVLGGDGGV